MRIKVLLYTDNMRLKNKICQNL